MLATVRRYILGRQEEPQALARIDESIKTVEGLLEARADTEAGGAARERGTRRAHALR